MKKVYSVSQVAEKIGVCSETVRRWDNEGKLKAYRHPINNYRTYREEDFEKLSFLNILETGLQENHVHITPKRRYKSIELFAGAGGLALGMEQAGLDHALLNEFDKHACATLRLNRPDWNLVEGDVRRVDFTPWRGKIDVVTGGFPCQAFSYAGKKMGFEDVRGTLFYEFVRCVKETDPQICIGENVRGLINHDGGKTLKTMMDVLEEIGYNVLPPQVLHAVNFRVPQKRERLVLVAIKRGSNIKFEYPRPQSKIYTVKDALKAGELFETDVQPSPGQLYPKKKKAVLDMIPPGGYWRDLPLDMQKQYMQKSFYLSGGKTGIARRISWDEPSLTLTCAPAQKQTERCHPEETRPFTVREYARIQTFTDDWQFAGSVSQQYKQIGNAVPVNLAYFIGQAVVKALNAAE